MAMFESDTVIFDDADSPAPQWLTALGIFFLAGTIADELRLVTLESSVELVSKVANVISTLI